MLPLFFVCWAGFKFGLKSRWVPYLSMDFESDRTETEGVVGDDESSIAPVEKVNWVQKVWNSI
ncbi:hypothetical protein HF325_001450 [Metschnikowia pulcherrima]|uniref:Uncharacterized protein n=1 Tax=Metschnikowia pulcherrima TaxID=27326 RepID=A0A8H7LGG6_9ASCO|nr:hypothetical protein HF325_001450 [Metschnikowia pulcherrima]